MRTILEQARFLCLTKDLQSLEASYINIIEKIGETQRLINIQTLVVRFSILRLQKWHVTFEMDEAHQDKN